MILLQRHYLGEDDHTNQWPLLITLVGIYFFWKWIQSVKNNSSPRNTSEASSKENNIKPEEVNHLEDEEPVIKPKVSLKGSLAGLSFKKSERSNPIDNQIIGIKKEDEGTVSEASKDAADKDVKPSNKIVLKDSLKGLSLKGIGRIKPAKDSSEDECINCDS